ncbi:MAG TPA: hypothetical protein VK364_03930 [Hymenobacter sp.]|nr:hypothetical protein [Hymenobacter sp.]
MKLEELIAISGDSELLSHTYTDGFITIKILLYEDDSVVSIFMNTDTVQVNHAVFMNKSNSFRCGRLEIKEISLEINNGCFMPPTDFVSLMKDVRSGFTLAYGRSEKDVRYILSFIGSGRLLSCLISDPEEVRIE